MSQKMFSYICYFIAISMLAIMIFSCADKHASNIIHPIPTKTVKVEATYRADSSQYASGWVWMRTYDTLKFVSVDSLNAKRQWVIDTIFGISKQMKLPADSSRKLKERDTIITTVLERSWVVHYWPVDLDSFTKIQDSIFLKTKK